MEMITKPQKPHWWLLSGLTRMEMTVKVMPFETTNIVVQKFCNHKNITKEQLKIYGD